MTDINPMAKAHNLFDAAFQAGITAAELDDLNFSGDPSRERTKSPHATGSFADTWWARGYTYQARLMRAIAISNRGNG